MATKNKELDVNYGLVIKVHIDTEILVFAIYYQVHILGVAPKKISRSGLNKFLKEQINIFGTSHDSLFGTSYEDNLARLSDTEYRVIENCIERIFFK